MEGKYRDLFLFLYQIVRDGVFETVLLELEFENK